MRAEGMKERPTQFTFFTAINTRLIAIIYTLTSINNYLHAQGLLKVEIASSQFGYSLEKVVAKCNW